MDAFGIILLLFLSNITYCTGTPAKSMHNSLLSGVSVLTWNFLILFLYFNRRLWFVFFKENYSVEHTVKGECDNKNSEIVVHTQ